MSNPNPPPLAKNYNIHLKQQWTVLNGMAYGLTQPTLYGVVSTNVENIRDFDYLEQFMPQWLEIEKVRAIKNQKSSHSLIANILTWQSRLQQQHKVPIFEKFHIQPVKSDCEDQSHYLVALPYIIPELTRELLSWFIFVVNYFIENNDELSSCSFEELQHYFADANKHLLLLREKLKRYQLAGMNTYQFIRAANNLAIPTTHVTQNVFRFGLGKHSYLLDSSFTEKTSVIGSKISKSKSNTARVVRNAGMPAPIHFVVSNEKQLIEYCDKLDYPLVVKPDNLDQGQGVFAHLMTKKQVIKAYKMAVKLSDRILIERHVRGDDYRLTVLNGKVIKVVKRTAAGVVGDGKLNITQLIKKEQASEFLQTTLRQTGEMKLSLDEEALDLLSVQSLNKFSIPTTNRYVSLRRKSNLSTGGTVSLINNSDVHPDNLALAIRAANAVNLDLAGIDLLIPNISQSWLESDAIICEINAQPQIGTLVTPHIYESTLETLMNKKTGIPAYLVIYQGEQNKVKRSDIEYLMIKHQCNTLVMKSGIQISGAKVTKGFTDSFSAIRALIHQQDALSALCFMSKQDVENIGLPLARFKVIYLYGNSVLEQESRETLIKKIVDHTEHLLIGDSGSFNEL